jgi:hypothetical protein
MVKLFAKNSATLPAKSGPNRILGNRLMRQPIGFHQILNTNSILPNLQKNIVLRSSWTIEIKGTFRSEKLFQGEFKVLSRSIKKSQKIAQAVIRNHRAGDPKPTKYIIPHSLENDL